MFIQIIGVAYLLLLVIFNFKKSKASSNNNAKRVAFFHPFCNDGGGGQKVLWTIVQALLEVKPTSASYSQYKDDPIITIYTLEPNSEKILQKVQNRFNIKLLNYVHRLNFVHVPGRSYLTPKPRLTMLCHIFLPMIYCFKCLWNYQPDIFYDTTGFAFNFLLVKLLLPFTECRAYVHYPFISEDMIAKIRQRRADFNNNSSISKSTFKTQLKLVYYNVILFMYRIVRFTVSSTQANSSWTQGHMNKIWGTSIEKLYPPCVLNEVLKFDKHYGPQNNNIISLAQFRPEKNHTLQINVFHKIKKTLNEKGKALNLHLYICGTTRGEDDEKLLQSLKQKVATLQLQKHITFCVNMEFPQLLKKLGECNYGIHSMEAEHFGISVVQMIAAGCLIVAHNSAGPKLDIIKDERFLAENQIEYEEKLQRIIEMDEKEKKKMSRQLRERMMEFGQVKFKENFRAIFNRKGKEN